VLINLITFPYQLAVCSRLWLYTHGWLKSKRLPRPVVSVGNLTVGGTGKTPMTMWVAQYLAAKGKQVAILSRGYRRHSQEKFLLVSDGKKVLTGPAESGDEPFLMATRCPGVIVAVGADRYHLGLWVLAQQVVDCFVLDDGFQHLNLDRKSVV
jgi:tetraacyldisaccharide 4'-kinase